MDPALITVLIGSAMAAVAAFAAYWSGVAATERRWSARESALLDDLDDAIAVIASQRPGLAPVVPIRKDVS